MPDKCVSEAAARSENYATTLVGSLETWVFVKIDGAGAALCDGAGVFVPGSPRQFQTTWSSRVDGSRSKSFPARRSASSFAMADLIKSDT